jgi:hypothetical protein
MKLSVDPVPVPRGYIHPPAADERLPRHEFTMGIIGKFLLRLFACSLYVVHRRFVTLFY